MTLGADNFIGFVVVFLTEMFFGIINRLIEPLKFKVLRLAKLKRAIALAQKEGRPPVVVTPELEATGILGDMLKALFFFSVEMLALVFSVLIVAFMFLFRFDFDVPKLHLRSKALDSFVQKVHDGNVGLG